MVLQSIQTVLGGMLERLLLNGLQFVFLAHSQFLVKLATLLPRDWVLCREEISADYVAKDRVKASVGCLDLFL